MKEVVLDVVATTQVVEELRVSLDVLGDEQDCLGGVAPPALLRLFRVAANLFVFLVELQVEAHVDLRGVVGLCLFGTLGYED